MNEAAQLIDIAKKRGIVVALAESCTGGLISAALTEIAGSSSVFDRGFVTYSNAAKMQMLGVRAATLDRFGAVSEKTAREMADGARTRSDAVIALSVTGIAGPGGSDHKPEGRVCFGISTPAGISSETREFGVIGRDNVRAETVAHGLTLLSRAILDFPLNP